MRGGGGRSAAVPLKWRDGECGRWRSRERWPAAAPPNGSAETPAHPPQMRGPERAPPAPTATGAVGLTFLPDVAGSIGYSKYSVRELVWRLLAWRDGSVAGNHHTRGWRHAPERRRPCARILKQSCWRTFFWRDNDCPHQKFSDEFAALVCSAGNRQARCDESSVLTAL